LPPHSCYFRYPDGWFRRRYGAADAAAAAEARVRAAMLCHDIYAAAITPVDDVYFAIILPPITLRYAIFVCDISLSYAIFCRRH